MAYEDEDTGIDMPKGDFSSVADSTWDVFTTNDPEFSERYPDVPLWGEGVISGHSEEYLAAVQDDPNFSQRTVNTTRGSTYKDKMKDLANLLPPEERKDWETVIFEYAKSGGSRDPYDTSFSFQPLYLTDPKTGEQGENPVNPRKLFNWYKDETANMSEMDKAFFFSDDNLGNRFFNLLKPKEVSDEENIMNNLKSMEDSPF